MFINGYEITYREIIFSVIIISIMTIAGIAIGNTISNNIDDNNIKYQTAVKIDNNNEQFKYGMDTDIGYAFIYGSLDAVDPVEIDGYKGISVSRELQKYTRHTRTVVYTDSEGHSHTKFEVYYNWDHIETDEKTSKQVKFCGSEFDTKLFPLPDSNYVDEKSAGYNLRYKYYSIKTHYDGTLFAKLENKSFSNGNFMLLKIEEAKKEIEDPKSILILFWVLWVLITFGWAIGFCFLDNKWLNK